ncbi:kinase C and casein kinase substrate in neurons 3 [Brachionus plicatilis]|uniref:Kinase C and casein kinase substrate in neurons 3 n=1 Tax=Brachionus plicatilis TaxID=10195 RepID=A0A3M7QG19_BRAPC|nr:kinase C and casein kinase substrate in neurons 3 [Brachionus plicatilis]
MKNETNNFQPSSGSSSNNTSNDAPMSNNSAEFNPFGNEEEEITEAQEMNKSDEEEERTVYLNVRVKALYDYHSAEDDELSFKAGEEMIKLANEDKRVYFLSRNISICIFWIIKFTLKLGNNLREMPKLYRIQFLSSLKINRVLSKHDMKSDHFHVHIQ